MPLAARPRWSWKCGPGVYRKNAQIAHIRGVHAPRYDPALSPDECASFTNLLILCLPHHGEVDDKKTGEKLYPVATLTRWKTSHEGADGPALARLGQVDEDTLASMLTQVFSPPAQRLEQIADQLEETGTRAARCQRGRDAPGRPQRRRLARVRGAAGRGRRPFMVDRAPCGAGRRPRS